MTAEPTAEDLLPRITRRDEQALAALYDRFAPLLRGIAVRILSSPDIAEEVLEETFVELWKRPDCEYQAKASVVAQLVLNTRNSAVRRLRQIRSLPPLQAGNRGARLRLQCLPQPDEIALVSSRQELVKRLFNQLPQAQRKVLELSILEGYSEPEIAQVLNRPLGRVRDEVRASLRFARQRLQTLLGTWTADI